MKDRRFSIWRWPASWVYVAAMLAILAINFAHSCSVMLAVRDPSSFSQRVARLRAYMEEYRCRPR